MTGLENIIKKIESDCDAKCTEIAAQAKKKCEDDNAKAVENARRQAQEILTAAGEKSERIIELGQKRISQNEKSALLAAKINAIDSVIDSARDILSSLPDDRYFALLLKLISSHCMSGTGLILLNSTDLNRLPEDFEENASAAAAEKGAELSVSDKAVPIKNGFLLKYGDIEINCTFDALISEKREELKETVNSILFQG